MATAQINARISADTKASGDRALSSVGCSPTRAIRLLWEFASRNRADKRALQSLLSTLEGSPESSGCDAQTQQRASRVQDGPLIFDRALASMGIDMGAYQPDEVPYEDLLAQSYLERMTDRGTLQ